MEDKVDIKNNAIYSKNQRKCLYSPIYIPKKEFRSVFLCKQDGYNKPKDPNTTFLLPHGPLIVIHREKKEKHSIPKKTRQGSANPFKYFEDHKTCYETGFYYNDINRPKILRHYSKDKKNCK
jgi:hypothetical protein